MIQKEEYLVLINNKNKVQRAKVQLDYNVINKIYTIYRVTGQYGGKEVEHPNLFIQFGKAGRTSAEQATLNYNSIINNYLNKGYKKLNKLTKKKYEELSEQDIKNLLNTATTDTKGIPKPMLAKSSELCVSDIFEKDWYVSRKLNGVRCLIYYKDNKVQSASRGGKTYNSSITHILEDSNLIEFFKKNPDIILDGEIYKHGAEWPLQRISGLARLQEPTEECSLLEYWIYDFISNDPFEKRWEKLQEFKEYLEDCCNIKVIEHKKMSGDYIIQKEHNKYVQEGFEGLIARNPIKEYGINKRSALYMVKLKEYKDAEYEVCGVREGLRPEDMSFELKTHDGKVFGAKPIGDATTREYYLNNYEQYIGKKATCKFFEFSKDGVPQQPILIHFRPDDE